jgi:hypothetical protein
MLEQEQESSLKNLFVPFTTLKAIHFIIGIGVLIFFNSLFNGFVGDDVPQIVENTYVHSVQNIPFLFTGSTFFNGTAQHLDGIYYKPLFSSSFALLYTVSGPNAFWYHLFQLCFAVINTILVFLLLKHFFKIIPAFLLSLLFLIHPVNSESVLYISDLQEVLFLFFGLLSLLLLLRCHSRKLLVIAALFLLCSLLSKETAILFLPMSLFYVYLFKRKMLYTWSGLLVLVLSIYLVLRINAIGLIAHTTPVAPIEKLNFLTRLMQIPEIIIFYLKTFFYPLPLSFSYNWVYPHISITHFYVPLFFVLCFLGLVAYFLYTNGKQSSKTYTKVGIFFAAWLVMGIVLHLQIIPLDNTVAERWFYFPIIGLLGIVGLVTEIYSINLKNKWIISIIIITFVVLSVRTFVRSFDYRDESTLVSKDIQVSRDDYNLENGMSVLRLNQGKFSEAAFYVKESIQHNPGWNNYNTLGTIYLKQGQYLKAKEAYEKALTYSDNYKTYQNIASLTLVSGKSEENIATVKAILRKFPFDSTLWLYLAILEYKAKNISDAKSAATKAEMYNYTQDAQISTISSIILNEQPLNIQYK